MIWIVILLLTGVHAACAFIFTMASLTGDPGDGAPWGRAAALTALLVAVLFACAHQRIPAGIAFFNALLFWFLSCRRRRRKRTLAELGAKSRARIEVMVRQMRPEGAPA